MFQPPRAGWSRCYQWGCCAHGQGHATDTYEEFVAENEALLKSLPPPLVALEYYKGGDLYFFDALQTSGTDPKRRPACACAPAHVSHVVGW